MKQVIYTVLSNDRIARDVYKIVLEGDTSAITAPGQFVNLKIDGFFLRRPISVCDCLDGELTLIYKVVGGGTKAMSELKKARKQTRSQAWETATTRQRAAISPCLSEEASEFLPFTCSAKSSWARIKSLRWS